LAAAWMSLLLLAYAVLYGFWASWMLGAGFGHRGFVEVIPIGVVLFAPALSSASRSQRTVLVSGALVCTTLTLAFMAGYWLGMLPMRGTPSHVYWGFVRAPWRSLARLLMILASH